MKYLDFETPKLKLHLELDEFTTAVIGDGNIGKTYIFNEMANAAAARTIPDNFFFINTDSLYMVKVLQDPVDALFVIDEFDAVRLMRPEIIKYLDMQINQVLLFGRDLHNIRINKHYLYIASRHDNKIVFRPTTPQMRNNIEMENTNALYYKKT